MLVLARYDLRLALALNSFSSPLLGNDDHDDPVNFMSEADSDLLAIIDRAVGKAALEALLPVMPHWVTLERLTALAGKTQPSDWSRFNWLFSLNMDLGIIHHATRPNILGSKRHLLLTFGVGEETLPRQALCLPPPKGDDIGKTWTRAGGNGKKIYYAYVGEDNVVKGSKALKRVENEAYGKLKAGFQTLFDLLAAEINWLDRARIPFEQPRRSRRLMTTEMATTGKMSTSAPSAATSKRSTGMPWASLRATTAEQRAQVNHQQWQNNNPEAKVQGLTDFMGRYLRTGREMKRRLRLQLRLEVDSGASTFTLVPKTPIFTVSGASVPSSSQGRSSDQVQHCNPFSSTLEKSHKTSLDTLLAASASSVAAARCLLKDLAPYKTSVPSPSSSPNKETAASSGESSSKKKIMILSDEEEE